MNFVEYSVKYDPTGYLIHGSGYSIVSQNLSGNIWRYDIQIYLNQWMPSGVYSIENIHFKNQQNEQTKPVKVNIVINKSLADDYVLGADKY